MGHWENAPCARVLQRRCKARAVVAREDDQRLVGRVAPLDRRQDLSHDGVRLHDEIGVNIQAALVFPGVADGQGRVRRRQWQIEKERPVVL